MDGAASHGLQDDAAFVEGLIADARQHRAVRHPFLSALVDGTVPRAADALVELIFQYHAYSSRFVAYLGGACAQLTDSQHVQHLRDNMSEERGDVDDEHFDELRAVGIEPEWISGVAHPQLFERFLAAVDRDVGSRPYDVSSTTWRDLFLMVCRHGGAAQAMGALGPGTESIVGDIYVQLLEAIDVHLDIGRRERVFFDLHAHFDDEHGDIIRQIAVELAGSKDGREGLARGVAMALQLREAFFDAQHRRALGRAAT